MWVDREGAFQGSSPAHPHRLFHPTSSVRFETGQIAQPEKNKRKKKTKSHMHTRTRLRNTPSFLSRAARDGWVGLLHSRAERRGRTPRFHTHTSTVAPPTHIHAHTLLRHTHTTPHPSCWLTRTCCTSASTQPTGSPRRQDTSHTLCPEVVSCDSPTIGGRPGGSAPLPAVRSLPRAREGKKRQAREGQKKAKTPTHPPRQTQPETRHRQDRLQ